MQDIDNIVYQLRTELHSDGVLLQDSVLSAVMAEAGAAARLGPQKVVVGTQLFIVAIHSDGIARQIAHINPVAVATAVMSYAHI